jgi:hypothetical protein
LRIAEVLTGALGFDERNISRREEIRIGAILRTLGYTRKKVRDGVRVLWAYVPPMSEPFPL